MASLPMAPLATLVDTAHHNITVDKQLVLELEVKVGRALLFNWFLGVGFRKTCPLNEHMPHAASQLGAQGVFWCFQEMAVA